MPGEDGLSACRRIARADGPEIIFLSALGEEPDRILGLEVGAGHYLTKPCSPREVLATVRAALRDTRSVHVTRGNARRGSNDWDCSGMAAWVLERAAPHAVAALGNHRAVARDFYRAIARAPIGRARGGWQRVAGIADARPGDVIAWLRPQGWSSPNTGHVAFVLERPLQIPGHPGTWAVRIADATSFGHQNDTRGDGQGGYGEGTLLVLTNNSGEAIAYGWYGTESDAVLVTQIVFGRPVG
jgi:hypothetical protein